MCAVYLEELPSLDFTSLALEVRVLCETYLPFSTSWPMQWSNRKCHTGSEFTVVRPLEKYTTGGSPARDQERNFIVSKRGR